MNISTEARGALERLLPLLSAFCEGLIRKSQVDGARPDVIAETLRSSIGLLVFGGQWYSEDVRVPPHL